MIRQLLLLSALTVVVVLAGLSADRPCIFPFLTKGDYKPGKTACFNTTTDCADAASMCMHNFFDRGPPMCCKQVPNLIVPTCPATTPTLMNPSKNPALKAWVFCNPVNTPTRKTSCPRGYSCVQATNDFTMTVATAPKYVCCK